MYWIHWHLCLEGYKKIWIQNTYCATLKVHLVACRIWWLFCLCSHFPSPSVVTNLCCLLFSVIMRIYRPQYTDRVCCESPSSCTSLSHGDVTVYFRCQSGSLTTTQRDTAAKILYHSSEVPFEIGRLQPILYKL